ncbi:MAG: DNA adenine methylase [Bacteroidota bacterium]
MKYLELQSNQYPGGKGSGGVYQKQINEIPPHKGFFSGFLGRCKVTQHKKPADVTYVFDLDQALIEEWETAIDNSEYFGPGQFFAINRSFFDVEMMKIAKHLKGDLFVYLDPPYLIPSRKSNKPMYQHELSFEQHEELIQKIKTYEWPVAICTLPNELYDQELGHWRVLEYETTNRSGQKVIEFMYMNYEKPAKLHDYNYIGNDFREREKRIRRFKNFMDKWDRMDALDKAKIIQNIESEIEAASEPYSPNLIASFRDTADKLEHRIKMR